ncbi:flippase-like domain-containing protein [Enterovirga sp.]|uniref:flippase-like domain-containing protein n=1 Tax=Enterovirga sp. TaxID=2026350 RepID=UPI002BB130A4|nr:flippase-like domain-containing protein [Enterovirga sp.]HMO28734.1 flippase-like domain-containing protein [Enterovirga sp.]
MTRIALVAGILGLTLLGVLLALSGLDDVAQAVAAAGWASAAVVAVRAVVLVAAGIGWYLLFPVSHRLPLRIALLLRFVREGVNQLLPVGQVGGDVVGARLATFWRMDGAVAGATTIADVAIQAATQAAFALLGVGLLVWLEGDSAIVRYAAGGVAVAALLIGAFFVAQARLGSRLLSAILRRFGGERIAAGLVDRLWSGLARVYAEPRRVAASSLVHMVGWLGGSLEVYVALHAMGYPVGLAEAVVIESLGQAVRGAAFAVPGGVGVQEGGFIALCAIFGVPAGPALALSLVKRVPDLVLGLPGLAVWQVLEGRHALRRDRPSSEGVGALSAALPARERRG